MDDKHDEKDGTVDNKKAQQKPATKTNVFLSAVPEPSKLKQWYFNYIMSDFTFASISTGILLTIKIWRNLPWDTFFSGIALWYIVYIATMISRIVKTACDYYAKKS